MAAASQVKPTHKAVKSYSTAPATYTDRDDPIRLCDLHSLAERLLDPLKNQAVPSLLAVTKRVPLAFN